MNPSQKYMPNSRNITDEDDIKLVPFNNNRQTLPTDQSNFAMSTTGWIPVYFFNNPPFNQMGNGNGNSLGSGMGTLPGGFGMGTSPGVTGMTSPSTSNGSFTMPTLPTFPNMNTPASSLDSENFFPFSPSTTPSNRELPNIIELLSNFDLDLDEDIDLARSCSDKSIDKIYEKIEKNHTEIFALVKAYNIPHPIFKLLIRRVIKLSISSYKRESE